MDLGWERHARRRWNRMRILYLVATAIVVATLFGVDSLSGMVGAGLFAIASLGLIFGRMEPRWRLLLGLVGAIAVMGGASSLPWAGLFILSYSALFLLSFLVPSWLAETVLAVLLLGALWHGNRGLTSTVEGTVAIGMAALTFATVSVQRRQMERERKDLFTTSGELNQNLKQVEYLAFHDALTGLPNRRLFMARLEARLTQAAYDGHEVGVVFIDLDEFKSINDTAGHGYGDRLLRAVVTSLQASLRPGDILARQGGDEFILVMAPSPEGEPLARHAESIREHLNQGVVINHEVVLMSASFGVAVFPRDGETADTLVRHADAALYRAKEEGKNRVSFYSAGLENEVPSAFYLDSAIHRAIQEEQLCVYYQPQVDMLTGRLIGVEAQIRWYPEPHRLVMPTEFLPDAQKIGLGDMIDDFVLDRALWEMSTVPWWPETFVSLAIHVSATRFDSVAFSEQVEKLLRLYHMPPNRVEIEITEALMIRRTENAVNHIRRLRHLGVSIAVRDFGVGLSSLRSLQALPISRIKINKTFVDQIEKNDAVARAIIAIAKSLKIDVVAAGVENVRQVHHLLKIGCDRAQGFYYSQAVPKDRLKLRYQMEVTSTR